MDVVSEVRDFIVNELGWDGDPATLTEDYPLIANNVVDSLGIFQLVTELEGAHGIEIDDEELIPENFGTLAAIDSLVRSKVRASESSA